MIDKFVLDMVWPFLSFAEDVASWKVNVDNLLEWPSHAPKQALYRMNVLAIILLTKDSEINDNQIAFTSGVSNSELVIRSRLCHGDRDGSFIVHPLGSSAAQTAVTTAPRNSDTNDHHGKRMHHHRR